MLVGLWVSTLASMWNSVGLYVKNIYVGVLRANGMCLCVACGLR